MHYSCSFISFVSIFSAVALLVVVVVANGPTCPADPNQITMPACAHLQIRKQCRAAPNDSFKMDEGVRNNVLNKIIFRNSIQQQQQKQHKYIFSYQILYHFTGRGWRCCSDCSCSLGVLSRIVRRISQQRIAHAEKMPSSSCSSSSAAPFAFWC